MIFEAKYGGRSAIVNGLQQGDVRFATNLLRETTYFEGNLLKPLAFREALAALYQVVVSDFKYRPKDRFEFQEWLKKQDDQFLAGLAGSTEATREKLQTLESRKTVLDDARRNRLRPFYRARREFFEHIYHNEYELMMLLDPVITVHPDELSFEAFSKDESTYARLSTGYDLFGNVGDFQCGTTNIDFSLQLHNELQRMRSYRRTHFTVNPSGLTVLDQDSGHIVQEKKIDLPDSWMKGFLQVHAVMAMSLTHVRMKPVDLYNLCRFLRRHRAKESPRSIRYELEPGRRGRLVLEPWDHEIELSTVYEGSKPESIRTWGRDRLRTLEKLIPVCDQVDVYLAGYGMPSFYVLRMGAIVFTLGLSGWTDNDWTGGTSFEQLTRRVDVDGPQLFQIYESLREKRFANEQDLAAKTSLSIEQCRSGASMLCQAGRAMFDLASNVFRHRDLLHSPFDLQAANRTVQRAVDEANPNAKAAQQIYEVGNARLIARRPVQTGWKLSGSVKGSDQQRVRPLLHVDHEGKIIEATCTCRNFKESKLTKGPCEHMLALRLVHMARLEAE